MEDLLPIDDIAKGIIIDILSKKTLRDVAPFFVKYGIWDENDKDFAIELTNLRNGIAHKNAVIVSRSKLVKGSGQDRHLHEIRMAMRKDLQVDCGDKELLGEFNLIDVKPYLERSWALKRIYDNDNLNLHDNAAQR